MQHDAILEQTNCNKTFGGQLGKFEYRLGLDETKEWLFGGLDKTPGLSKNMFLLTMCIEIFRGLMS